MLILNGSKTNFTNSTLIVGSLHVHPGGELNFIRGENTVYHNNNWTIEGNVSSNELHIMNGTYDGEVNIIVESGGNLTLYDGANITNGDNVSANFNIIVRFRGLLSITDSQISNSGWDNEVGKRGLEINTTNVTFNNVTIKDSFIGATIYSDNISITNSTFKNWTQGGIFLRESNNNIIDNNLLNGSSNGIDADITNNLTISNNRLIGISL